MVRHLLQEEKNEQNPALGTLHSLICGELQGNSGNLTKGWLFEGNGHQTNTEKNTSPVSTNRIINEAV